MNPKHSPELSTVPETKLPVKNWGNDYEVPMSKAAEDLYKRVCEARVETWKKDLEEDIKVRDLFLEAGRKAFSEAGKVEDK